MAKSLVVDLNADVGELDQFLKDGTYERLIGSVTSISVACMGHAGSEKLASAMIKFAKKRGGVKVGAHPSYPDRKGFGRVKSEMETEQLVQSVRSQLMWLSEIATSEGMVLSHVKPHGALYHDVGNDDVLAKAMSDLLLQIDPGLRLYGLMTDTLVKHFGTRLIVEGFTDRVYESPERLMDRSIQGAVIQDQEKKLDQAKQLVLYGGVKTLCIHGDQEGCDGFAMRLRTELNASGISVKPWD